MSNNETLKLVGEAEAILDRLEKLTGFRFEKTLGVLHSIRDRINPPPETPEVEVEPEQQVELGIDLDRLVSG